MKVIDLFSGAGGMGLGFLKAGSEILLAFEKDVWAAETYKYNHKNTTVICSDIKEVKISNYTKENIDIVIGGPPCQGFSLSGRRDKNDPRNSLFMEFVRIVEEVQPKFFVMENVKGLLSMKTVKNESVKELIIKEFESIGYSTEYSILNSSDYGVPQNRERVFFIGIKKEEKEKLGKVNLFPKKKNKKKVSIEEAISDLPYIESGEGKEILEYIKGPETNYQKTMRKGSKKVYNHQAMRHTKRIIDRFNVIKEGESLADVSKKHMQRKRGDVQKISGKVYSQNNMRPFYNKPSPTITASFQSNFVHPKINRNFTAREAARLQSFPDNYIFKGKRTTMSWEDNLSQYQQIGNAVPPLLSEEIARNLINIFNKGK